jgi:hypothetical protein
VPAATLNQLIIAALKKARPGIDYVFSGEGSASLFEAEPGSSVVSKTFLFETKLLLNSRINPNTLHNMRCKNF